MNPARRLAFWLRFYRQQVIFHIGIGAVALTLGLLLAPHILYDDAAISLRYAHRLASGMGFTYNDHEHVLGASNPLYTLLLSAFEVGGIDAERAARAFGLLLFVTSVLLTAHIAARLGGSTVAGIAGLLLALDPFYRYQSLNGMESVLAVCLGLATAAALLEDRPTLAGVFIGLAVWNKLDAAALALAAAIAFLVVRRRFPFKMALVSALVVLPWITFAWWYYGSPVPQSFIAKVQHGAAVFDHWWVARLFRGDYRWLVPALGLSILVFWTELSVTERLVSLALIGWFLIHATAFSVLNLGDYYPWYLTVLVPPPLILAVAASVRALRVKTIWWWLRLTPIALLIVPEYRSALTTFVALSAHPIMASEAFDADRRLAGMFLNRFAKSDEILDVTYGWPAFETKNPINDRGGLNTKTPLTPPAYFVEHGMPYTEGFNPPKLHVGYIPVATFNLTSDLYPGYSWFVVFAHQNSQIATSGKRYVQLRLFELPPPEPMSAEYGLSETKIDGADLRAHPPSGATFLARTEGRPLHVVFTPSFNPSVPFEKTDGATFDVWSGGSLLYRRHVVPEDNSGPVVLRVPPTANSETTAISFSTSGGPYRDRDFDWAIWRNVKVIIGDAYINRADLDRLRDSDLARQWTRFNPVEQNR